jgi:hypothetical protein
LAHVFLIHFELNLAKVEYLPEPIFTRIQFFQQQPAPASDPSPYDSVCFFPGIPGRPNGIDLRTGLQRPDLAGPMPTCTDHGHGHRPQSPDQWRMT